MDVSTEIKWIQLQAACFEGRTQDVQVLLHANTDVNHVSSAGYTPLYIAVAKNDINLVTLLVGQNANVNIMTSRRQAPLHVAAENGNNTIIQKLLTMKADPNLKDEIGNTSLHLSVQLKQETKPKLSAAVRAHTGNVPYRARSVQTIQTLIDHGVDVNAVNNRHKTALWFACCDGQDEFVKILLHAGADPGISDKYGDSSLHSAISGCCSRETIQEIIKHGAHVNAANNIGDTARLLASCKAQTEIVRVLLTAKADPNIANRDGDASLHGAAAANCSEETLQEIIKYGADVNAVNRTGKTPLLLSCFYGQKDLAKVLLRAGADPSISDEQSFSSLHAAVDGRCNKDTLQTLIDHGAHTDAKRKDGATALLSACRTGQSESVMFLLESGADVNIIKPDGTTCLHLAVHGHCSKEALLKIIEQGANVNALNNNGQTALVLACYTAQEKHVKVLLKRGADPNISDASGNSSLLFAVSGHCSNKTLQEIITQKADLDYQNNKGRTALALACFYGHYDSVKVLLEAASNPNISDNEGCTSLHTAAIGGSSKKIIQAIINHGADVKATSKKRFTALMMACKHKNLHTAKVLLKAGSDTNIADKDGNTCLMYAVHCDCNKDVLQAIIDRGADVNMTDKSNVTALMIALVKKYTDAILLLLKAGADPNIRKDDCTATCLMYAVDTDCSKEVLQAITDHGADVNATSKETSTALMIACEKSYTDAINVLLEAGADPNIALDDSSVTCFMCAVLKDCSKDVLQAMIDHGADVNATSTAGTALMIACTKRYTDAIYLLLKAGANPNIADDSGVTCLMRAVGEDCSNEVLQAIIDHGAEVNSTSKENGTALMIACTRRYKYAINLLLEARANPNIVLDDTVITCLMFAVGEDCSKEVLQAIVNHGADVNATGKGNHTVLIKACENGYTDAINDLVEAGTDPNIALDDSGFTCFMFAVGEDCSKEMLQVIIDHGADVNTANNENCTALMLACAKRYTDAIDVPLKAGAMSGYIGRLLSMTTALGV